MRKREIDCYKQFLLFSQCFPQLYIVCQNAALCGNGLIDHLGLTYIRLFYDNNVNYPNVFKTRLQDQFIQEWKTSINNSPKLSLYRKFKRNSVTNRIFWIANDKCLKSFACFSLCSHKLEVESGRFSNIPREERICKLCTSTFIEN